MSIEAFWFNRSRRVNLSNVTSIYLRACGQEDLNDHEKLLFQFYSQCGLRYIF